MTHIETTAENYRQPFRGSGNHISSMDIKKSFEDGADYGYKYALNKVYKYIEEHIFDFPWYDTESELSSTDIVEEIRKAMEE